MVAVAVSLIITYWLIRLAVRGALRDHHGWVKLQRQIQEFPEEIETQANRPTASGAPVPSDISAELARLKRLREREFIDDEDFAAAQRKLLGE